MLPAAIHAEENCLLKIFEHFCLGGSVEQLMKQQPGMITTQAQGDHYAVVYAEGAERIYAMAYKGVLYKILRRYGQSTEAAFDRLHDLLSEKYGKPRDASDLPMNDKREGKPLGAIRRGQAQLLYVWTPPEATWRVELSWTRGLGIAVAYFDNARDAEQKAAMGSITRQ